MVYESISVPNPKTIMPPINVKNPVVINEENSGHYSVRPDSRNRHSIRQNVYKTGKWQNII